MRVWRSSVWLAPQPSCARSLPQRRHARERPGQDVEGLGCCIAHGKCPSPGVGRKPQLLHPLQHVRVHESKIRQGQHEQLRHDKSADDEVGDSLARGRGDHGKGARYTSCSCDRD